MAGHIREGALVLEDNCPQYWDAILKIRNENRESFFTNAEIDIAGHHKYMAAHGDSYKVCVLDGEVCGFIGVVDGDIRFAVSKKHQRRGIGEFMLRSALRDLGRVAEAKVLPNNEASLGLFKKLGFRIKHVVLTNETQSV